MAYRSASTFSSAPSFLLTILLQRMETGRVEELHLDNEGNSEILRNGRLSRPFIRYDDVGSRAARARLESIMVRSGM